MADFFFFTDTDLLNPQNPSEAFGPVSGSTDTNYRLCSLHSASSDPAAYAICNGIIFIQENSSDSSLVNLVLKPTIQSKVNFPFIKYIIYKGIRKDSLIAAGGAEVAAASSNDLTNAIWSSQTALNESLDRAQDNPVGTTTDTPPAEALGINYTPTASSPYTAADNDPLSKPFFRTNVDFQLPQVKGGWSIGKFAASSFGLEIMFETIGIKPTFGIARQFDHVLNVTPLAGGESQSVVFDHWNGKEQILSYLDPAAFFGAFYSDELGIKSSTDTSFTSVATDDVYSEVVSKFVNKNRTYLDIRNTFNFSFDYDNNYGRNLNIAYDNSGALVSTDYYSANWPILIIDADFPSGNTSSTNIVRLTLPKGDHDYSCIYFTKSMSETSFPEYIEGRSRFIRLQYDNISTFNLDEIKLIFPNFVSTDTTPIASFSQLKYLRSLILMPTVLSHDTVLVSSIGYDNIFPIFEMELEWEPDATVMQSQVINDQQFVDLIRTNGHSFMANRGIAKDPNGDIIFFAFSVQNHTGSKIQTSPISITGDSDGGEVHFLGKTALQFNSAFAGYSRTVGGSSVLLEEFGKTIAELIELDPSANESSPHEFVYVKLTATEYLALETIKNDPSNGFLNGYRVFLSLKIIEANMVDQADFSFAKYEYELTGYELDTGSNEIKTKTISSGIYTYRRTNLIDLRLIVY
jgi:hypothetical protein